MLDNATKPQLNPNLAKSIAAMRENNTEETRNLMVNEVMRTGFLTPAQMDPIPEVDADGRAILTKDTKISFMNLKNNDGGSYLGAFTEKAEIERWNAEDKLQTIMVTFDDLAHIVLTSNGQLNGFVINPFHESITFESDLIANLAEQKRAFQSKTNEDIKKEMDRQAIERAAQGPF
ncbi:MAG TPA: SseB family protein [Clostridiales bacterium]|nr:SseB family protein [Clostridiales bacterium]